MLSKRIVIAVIAAAVATGVAAAGLGAAAVAALGQRSPGLVSVPQHVVWTGLVPSKGVTHPN